MAGDKSSAGGAFRQASQTLPSLPSEVREVVDALVSSLGDGLKAVLWHGSWARGEAKAGSDHDLIVVLKRMDGQTLLRLREAFRGRANWSTFVQTEEELRQYPLDGRLQFHFGAVPLYGQIDPPAVDREALVNDLRVLARDIRFECRYRLLHKEPAPEIDERLAGFQRARNVGMLGYAAKWALLAMKARELLEGRDYPVTREQLRKRLNDPQEVAILELVEDWAQARRRYEHDLGPLALLLDAFARKLVAWLDSGAAANEGPA